MEKDDEIQHDESLMKRRRALATASKLDDAPYLFTCLFVVNK